ncbi:MAG: prepilin-type N-terminal cleavage/methylation domain-containing protein, partial [Candidatus Nealsonbacteria bacterium]|nr:prepilin-type N-terminal cleavage/methylation domain-containing protein [Candidatus Nealsonbacteria bacterium]
MIWNWIKKNNLKKGITLIEMIVVIALIFIISGTMWANYRNLGKSLALDRSANQVAQDIRASLE